VGRRKRSYKALQGKECCYSTRKNMNNESITPSRYTWKQRAIVGVPLGVIILAVVAACGGGSSATDVTPAAVATTTDGVKTALAATTTASVPAGWQGRAPKMEVINGISVPPEPAPALNNATLAGVDVNGNGVRDDVERVVAKNSRDPKEFAALLTYAATYQKIVTLSFPTVPDPTLRPRALKAETEIICAENKVPPESKVLSGSILTDATFNSKERTKLFANFTSILGGVNMDEVSCE